MRLPAYIPDFSQDVSLYSFVPDKNLKFFSMGKEDLDTFMVVVSEIPDCQSKKDPLDCTVGIIGVSETDSKSDIRS